MTRIFIASSGTDIGKTFLAVALTRYLRAKGHSVRVCKPIATGYIAPNAGFNPEGIALEKVIAADRPIIAGSFEETDTAHILAAMGLEASEKEIANCSPWRFDAPLSPNMAAKRENRPINFEEVLQWCRAALNGPEDFVFLEPTAGVMVPLDEKHTVVDWIEALDIPAIIIVGSYLGTISHTLTALVSLRDIPVKAVIVNESLHSTVPLEETADTIRHFTKAPVVTLTRNPSEAQIDAIVKLLTI